MTKSILKVVLVGIAIGALAFFVPKLLAGIFIFAILVKLIFCGKGHGCCGSHLGIHRFEMADKIRSMSEAEYAEFKTNHSMGCCNNKPKCCSNTDGDQNSKDTNSSK